MSRPGIEIQTQRIIQATLELLATRPVEDLTAQLVAKTAGASRATFYRCFPSIQAVIEAIYSDFSSRIIARLQQQLEQSHETSNWLEAVVRQVVFDAHHMGPALVSLYREELRPDSIGGRYARDRVQRQVELLATWWRNTSERPPQNDELFVLIVNLLQHAGLRASTLGNEELEPIIGSNTFALRALIAYHRADAPALEPVKRTPR